MTSLLSYNRQLLATEVANRDSYLHYLPKAITEYYLPPMMTPSLKEAFVYFQSDRKKCRLKDIGRVKAIFKNFLDQLRAHCRTTDENRITVTYKHFFYPNQINLIAKVFTSIYDIRCEVNHYRFSFNWNSDNWQIAFNKQRAKSFEEEDMEIVVNNLIRDPHLLHEFEGQMY